MIFAAAEVLLLLVVLVGQFRSLWSAIAVLLTTALAVVGAFALLWITNTPLDTSFAGALPRSVGRFRHVQGGAA